MADQFLEEILKEKILFRKSAPFVEVLITLQKNASKGSDKRRKKLARLVIPTIDEHNVHLENVPDVNIKIT